MSDYTSIPVSKEIKEKLTKIKESNNYNNYNEVLNDLLKDTVNVKDYTLIPHDNIAYTLHKTLLDEQDNIIFEDTRNITYNDLQYAEIGDDFSPRKTHSGHYSLQTAKVVYKSSKLILLYITEKTNTSKGFNEYNELIGIDLN